MKNGADIQNNNTKPIQWPDCELTVIKSKGLAGKPAPNRYIHNLKSN